MSFQQDDSAGNKIISAALQSPNYAKGSSGWTINRDGSAEFQNVLVRGTITASTIIGSTITGGTITAGEINSANFSNTTHHGWDLNGTNTADSFNTPANTIQVYDNFYVGPQNGNWLQLLYNGSAAALQFHTSNPAETNGGAMGVTTFVQPVSGRTISNLVISGPVQGNGDVGLEIWPSGGTTANDFPGVILATSGGATSPPGKNGINGQMFLGSPASPNTDLWQLYINNENSVISSGTTLGNPAVILGNTNNAGPQSRLYMSVNELLSIDGSGNSETFYLNENNAETVAGIVASTRHRQVMASLGTSSVTHLTTGTTGAYGFYANFNNGVQVVAGYTGTIVVNISCLSAASTATSTARMSFTVQNTGGTNVAYTLGGYGSQTGANDLNGTCTTGTGFQSAGLEVVISGLTPGTAYNIFPEFRGDSGQTATFYYPQLTARTNF